MKRITMNQVAKASLKANPKAYRSLAAGIFLAVYLLSATILSVQGLLLAKEDGEARRYTWGDVYLTNFFLSDEAIRDTGFFDLIGHITKTAYIEDSNEVTGYYDETAEKLMYRVCEEGRMPEKAGEMASERSALSRLGLDNMQIGETVTWEMHPFQGETEKRNYTLVGILNEQSSYLNASFVGGRKEYGTERLPAVLVSCEEPAYRVGTPVVYRMATIKPFVRFGQIRDYQDGILEGYRISRILGTVTKYDVSEQEMEHQAYQVSEWLILSCALLIVSCVAISMAMESMLVRKNEDIGMMRAVGATRSQIRRLFGRDAWILMVTALPIGILAGLGTNALLAWLFLDKVMFRPSAVLLIPIIGITLLCIFLSTFFPLHCASKLTPMGVLRDTALLRKAKRFRNQMVFRPSSLIAIRKLRLHPFRPLGGAAIVACMLFCMILLTEIMLGSDWFTNPVDQSAFLITQTSKMDGTGSSLPFSHVIFPDEGLSIQDIDQIEAIPGIQKVQTCAKAKLTLLLPDAATPDYFLEHKIAIYNGEQYAGEFYTNANDDSTYSAHYLLEEGSEEWKLAEFTWGCMKALQKASGRNNKMVNLSAYIVSLENGELNDALTEGGISLEALDAGEEVLIYTPNICSRIEEDFRRVGGEIEESNRFMDDEIQNGDWDVVIQNDFFFPGMKLDLIQVCNEYNDDFRSNGMEGYYSLSSIRSMSPCVGGILKGRIQLNRISPFGMCLITTPKGALMLGLKTNGVIDASVFLDGEPDIETEEMIESELKRISLRRGMELTNRLKTVRDEKSHEQRIALLFLGMVFLFFAVAVAIHVTGISRRIQADRKVIGTIRAVGAEKKTIVRSYSIPAVISCAWGFCIAAAVYLVLILCKWNGFPMYHPGLIVPLTAILSLACVFCSLLGIHLRTGSLLRQSIVENIREL